ncbi:hypothetical protein NMY22_g9983 [Coprinellus aureogranulatus]|nr:hypothetical protein NMY22_g9983 [Coprinellus aureogranulatus]
MTLELRETVAAVGLSGPVGIDGKIESFEWIDARGLFTPKMVAAAWYTLASPLKSSTAPPSLSQSEINTLFQRAESLHAAETSSFASGSSSKSRGLSDAPSGGAKGEMAFFAKVAGTGTLSDRLSALTLMVQSSPVHNTKALETLKGMAERGRGKGGREEALKAIRCVVDWWVGGGVPDRKLRYFRDQPLAHPDRTDEHLVVWYFEDWLKKYFFGILQILETLSLDTLPYVRTQALTLIATLLHLLVPLPPHLSPHPLPHNAHSSQPHPSPRSAQGTSPPNSSKATTKEAARASSPQSGPMQAERWSVSMNTVSEDDGGIMVPFYTWV